MKTSFFKRSALALALLAGSAWCAGIAYADTPPKTKFHSPFNGDKEVTPGERGEASEFSDLLDLYKKMRDAAQALMDAKACGTQAAIDKAQAGLTMAQSAFEKSLYKYIEGWSNFTYPRGAEAAKDGDIYKGDLKKVEEELNKRVTASKTTAFCPPQEHTALPGGDTAWTGPFIGFDVVASGSEVGLFEYFDPTHTLTNEFHDSGSGVGIGINGGYNWQPWDPNVVVGVVFNVDLVHDGVRHDFPPSTAYIGSVTTLNGTVQGRGGYLVTPQLLVYGQGGVTFGEQTLNIDFGGPETSEHKSSFGYVFGGGVEMQVPGSLFGGQMSLFVDYDHVWWDDASLMRPAASPFFDYDWRRSSDIVRLGARFQF